jgi:hypothetical protein
MTAAFARNDDMAMPLPPPAVTEELQQASDPGAVWETTICNNSCDIAIAETLKRDLGKQVLRMGFSFLFRVDSPMRHISPAYNVYLSPL